MNKVEVMSDKLQRNGLHATGLFCNLDTNVYCISHHATDKRRVCQMTGAFVKKRITAAVMSDILCPRAMHFITLPCTFYNYKNINDNYCNGLS